VIADVNVFDKLCPSSRTMRNFFALIFAEEMLN